MASISLTITFPSGDTKEISHPVGSDALRRDMQQLGHSIMRVKEEANVILTEAVNREARDQTQAIEMRSAGEEDDDDGEELQDVPVLVANVVDQTSLDKMCQRAKLVLNCVGPYALYGDAVVRACVENKTHHLDISGEPVFLERTQLLYHGKAKEQGIYIIGACGWDSIPAEMGFIYTNSQFNGRLCYLENYASFHHGPLGSTTNSGTWRSAVNSFSSAGELKRLRASMPVVNVPKPKHGAPKRSIVFYSKEVDSWCVPFFGCDKTVIYRTQKYNYEKNQEQPVPFNAFMRIHSLLYVVGMVPVLLTMTLLSSFSYGRQLLTSYPRLFSAGMFSDSGPTRAQVEGSSFTHTFVGYGHDKETDDDKDAPRKRIVTQVTGPDAAYISTPICLVQAAYCVLNEQEKMPSTGGVLTPGAAFADTSLLERLQRQNIKFSVLEQ